ncbi:MAG: dihydrodipicolinate synthase family protein [Gemmataceae bacterium]
MAVSWRGVYPAVTTAFNDDQSVDLAGTLAHVERLLASGVHGLVMLGTVGENCSLEAHEKREILRATVDQVARRVPVLTGVSEYTTDLACRFAADCQGIGLDGLMVLPAMVYKGDAREMMVHFRMVAASSDLPVMVYNNPPSYGVDITPEMFAEMADVATLEAIKESSADTRRITDIINLTGDRYTIFAGVDDVALECIVLGAVGWISGLVNAFPDENRLMWDLLSEGKLQEALAVYRWYMPLLHMDTVPKLVQLIKLAMAERGFGSEAVRRPRLTLEGEERERALAVIRRAVATRPGLV